MSPTERREPRGRRGRTPAKTTKAATTAARRVPRAEPGVPDDELEDRWERLGQFIRDQRRQAEMSVRRLADLSGVSNPYLSQIERGLKKPSAEILLQIAKALRISASTLYTQAGLLDHEHELDPELEPIGVIEAIELDPDLSDDQKQSLIRVYESFRRIGS